MTIEMKNRFDLCPSQTIIGIYDSNTAGVALVRKSRLVFAAAEERFTRSKQQAGFPRHALAYCLRNYKIDPNEVLDIAYGGYNPPSREALLDYLDLAQTSTSKNLSKYVDRLYNSLNADFLKQKNFYTEIKGIFPNANVHSVDHHKAHAYSAFTLMNLTSDYVIVADGRGDLQSLTVWKNNNGRLERVITNCELRSLGFFYGQITAQLGFTPYKHEGKVTGLAAYGKPSELNNMLDQLIYFDKGIGNIRVSDDYQPYNRPIRVEYLENLIKGFSREQVAYAAQSHLEKVLISFIKHIIPSNCSLGAAGGVFANVKLNQRIRESCQLNHFMVFPEMSDGGLCVGAAYSTLFDSKGNYTSSSMKVPNETSQFETEGKHEANEPDTEPTCNYIQDMYLGVDADWRTISELKNPRYKVLRFESLQAQALHVAIELSTGRIGGMIIGRAEFGPRALGARSILFHPNGPYSLQMLNDRFSRSEFMPFGPVILREVVSDYLVDISDQDFNTSYMTTCYECKAVMKLQAPLVVHVDGTCRPQIVDSDHTLQVYRKILEAFHGITAIGCLANTSFNRHEEPIVNSAIDGLKALEDNLVDFLVTDDLSIVELSGI